MYCVQGKLRNASLGIYHIVGVSLRTSLTELPISLAELALRRIKYKRNWTL